MAKQIDEKRPHNSEIIRLLQQNQVCEKSNIIEGWNVEEINCLLKLIVDYDYLEAVKSEGSEVFVKLSRLLTIGGFRRSTDELKGFWRDLRRKIENNKSGKLECHDLIKMLNFEDQVKVKSEMTVLEDKIIEQSDKHKVKKRSVNPRNIWSRKETEIVVKQLEKYGMPTRTNLRKVSCLIVNFLKKQGHNRNEEQVLNKIKQLRSLYSQVLRKALSEDRFCYFKRIESLMRNVRTSESEDREIETGVRTIMVVGADRKGRQIWNNKEIGVLLDFIEENKIVSGKDIIKLANKAQDFLMSFGYYRSPCQIVNRWKNTRSLYWSTYRKQLEDPERECVYYYRLQSILNTKSSCYEAEHYQNINGSEETIFYSNDDTLETKVELNNFSAHVNEFCSTNSFVENTSSTCASEVKNDLTVNCSNCSSFDSVDHYCISLSDSIKKLDPRRQAKLKIEIQKLMYNAEFDSNF